MLFNKNCVVLSGSCYILWSFNYHSICNVSQLKKMDRGCKKNTFVCVGGFFCKEMKKIIEYWRTMCLSKVIRKCIACWQIANNNGFLLKSHLVKKITSILLRWNTNCTSSSLPPKWESAENFQEYSFLLLNLSEKKLCVIDIVIRRISFSFFLICEFHLLI